MREEYFEYIENQRNSEFGKNQLLRKRAEYEEFKNRRFMLYGIMFSIIGLVFILTKDLALSHFDKQFSFAFIMFGASSFAFGLGFILFRYLQNGAFSKLSLTGYSNQYLQSELQNLKVELLKLRKKNGQPSDNENISKVINDAIDNTLTEDFIKSKIDSVYSDKAISESKRRDLHEDFENLSFRINGELTRLRNSANLNLVIGTIITISAIFALGYEVFNAELDFSDSVKVLSHYLPRLSLILFIEIFAFFFLKMYKASLADIKYFNNEKTNIDFKVISLKSALSTGDTELIKLMLQDLIQTERNFKLGKDESTVELEKIKNEAANSQVLIKLVDKLNQK